MCAQCVGRCKTVGVKVSRTSAGGTELTTTPSPAQSSIECYRFVCCQVSHNRCLEEPKNNKGTKKKVVFRADTLVLFINQKYDKYI